MIRLILICIFFLLSLLNVFRAPMNLLWYVSILTTEFCWVFFITVCFLLFFRFGNPKFDIFSLIIGMAALVLYSIPVIGAYRISSHLSADIGKAFGTRKVSSEKPFQLSGMITGIHSEKVVPRSILYDTAEALSLDFYPSAKPPMGKCILVIHGGSWAGGSKDQLPELNSYLALRGYNVFSIEYRLAPANLFPAPVMDVNKVLHYLNQNARELNCDASSVVILGRSAGAQIALTAAYGLNNSSIKGVISYYGPTDMVWGYSFPANPLVLDSRGIMEDYLGGSYDQVPEQYRLSSATEIVNDRSVPTLLIQGKNDPLVAYDHCNRLDKKLNEHAVPHYVLRLPWATHGCDYTLNGPAGQLCTFATVNFLNIVLD